MQLASGCMQCLLASSTPTLCITTLRSPDTCPGSGWRGAGLSGLCFNRHMEMPGCQPPRLTTAPCTERIKNSGTLNPTLTLATGMRRCKAHNTTVQGAVTAATMIAQAAAQAANSPLPQTIVMQCPVDVRKQVCAPPPQCRALDIPCLAVHVHAKDMAHSGTQLDGLIHLGI